MAGSITRTTEAAALPTIIAQEALGQLARYSSMARFVSRDYDGQVASYGEAVKIYKRGALAVQDKTADTDITFNAPTGQGSVTVTLNQHKVVPIKIEDVAQALARPDLRMGYAQDAAIVLAEAVDDVLLALATDASVTQEVGTAGTPITKGTLIDARTRLNKSKAPRAPRAAVLDSDSIGAMLKDGILVAANTAGGNSTNLVDVNAGELRPAFGFSLAENQGVTVTAGTPNKVNSLAFHQSAIVLATRPLADPGVGGIQSEVLNSDGFSIRVMADYDIKAMAMLITLDVLFGVKIVRPEHVVRIAS